MAKIAMIGAGSLIFCKTLVMDILATEALKGSALCLMSRTKPKLDRMEAFVKRVIRENGLPATVATTLDRRGLHPAKVGELPLQCAALNMSNITVQQLTVQAALTGDPECAMQAVAMDPLAGAVCTLAEMRAMAREMFKAEAQWLPQFQGRLPAPRPVINIQKNVKPMDVPVDPALAVANRFGQLATQKVARKK